MLDIKCQQSSVDAGRSRLLPVPGLQETDVAICFGLPYPCLSISRESGICT